jgi:hypothetical protein
MPWQVPARNRVTPLGDLVAIPLRGAFTGNRGRLHEGREVVRFRAGELWIICALRFNDRRHEQWQPRHFTWLYFHDEAVAFAAGHRPCGECRHGDYVAFRDAFSAAAPDGAPRPSADELNRRLHGERIVRGTHRRRLHHSGWSELPDGAFVLSDDGVAALVLGRELIAWGHGGYGARHARPRRGTATVITPPSTLAAIRAGYTPQIDPSARA